MKKRDQSAQQPSSNGRLPHASGTPPLQSAPDPTDALGEHIARALYEQSKHIYFTPSMRETLLRHLPAKRRQAPARLYAAGLALAAIVILAVGVTFYFSQQRTNSAQSAVTYISGNNVPVSSELAHNGRILSLDPAEKHLVYEAADQPGVLYTIDISNPIGSNFLAMRYARDAAWAPDGSALVATVVPEGTPTPLLALVPTGQYMHLIGHDALAATWSPKERQQITYTIGGEGNTQLWSTPPDGKTTQLLATVPQSLSVQHMTWSRDGQHLALTVSETGAVTKDALQQPSHSIYLIDAQTKTLNELVKAGDFTLGSVAWSPDGRSLAYEQIDHQGRMTLQVIEVAQPQRHTSIIPQHNLNGWSWSPDSRVLLYSDNGALRTKVFSGPDIHLPGSTAQQISPFWLKDGRILYLRRDHGEGKLAYLLPQK